MKRIYSCLALVSILASCSNTQTEDQLKAKQFTIDSLNAVTAQKEIEKANTTHVVVVKESTPVTPVTPAKKKGWSNLAKGAVIGGVVGAGTGVAVSKNKVKGGIIGGVVGAAAGAGVGAIIDKKKQ
jgi:uncharacterized membrane protein